MRRRSTPPWLRAARAQDRSPTQGSDWLSRALARAGHFSSADADTAVREGRIRINGKVQREPLAAVAPTDRVDIDGRKVSLQTKTLAFVFHKPKGLIVSSHDREGVGTVFQAFHQALPQPLRSYGWHAIGRLDRNTTGLLLFTNDERLVAHATTPASKLPKRYVAHVSLKATDAQLSPLRTGITLDDGPARAVSVGLRAPGVVELVLDEGRNHQVKRMLGAVGLPVLELHREAIGTLELDVPLGHIRLLDETEVTEKLAFSSHQTSQAQ